MSAALPGNPYAKQVEGTGDPVALAVLALAYEQRQRNRLAAITARMRRLPLPDDLAALTKRPSRKK